MNILDSQITTVALNTQLAMSSIICKAYKLADQYEFRGLPISVETKKGQVRKGIGTDGKPWSIKMPYDYGYIKGKTEGKDGELLDCFIGPDEKADNVYVIHQCKEDDKDKYDEDKCMLGFDSKEEAEKAYKSAYNIDLFMGMHTFNFEDFVEAIYHKKNKGKALECGGPGSGRKQSSPITQDGWLSKQGKFYPNAGKHQHLETAIANKLGAGYTEAWANGHVRVDNLGGTGTGWGMTYGANTAEARERVITGIDRLPDNLDTIIVEHSNGSNSFNGASAKVEAQDWLDKGAKPWQALRAEDEATLAKGVKWIGVDLDGTLAYYTTFKGPTVIGKPILPMVKIIKQHLADGENIKIFTARVENDPDNIGRKTIEKWCKENLGKVLPITCVKDPDMVMLYDDRAVGVEYNKGKLLSNPDEVVAAVEAIYTLANSDNPDGHWHKMRRSKEIRCGIGQWKKNPITLIEKPVSAQEFKELAIDLRDSLVDKALMVSFNPKELVTNQPFVIQAELEYFAYSGIAKDEAIVLKTPEGLYVHNGNHRAALALLAGKDFKARYVDLTAGGPGSGIYDHKKGLTTTVADRDNWPEHIKKLAIPPAATKVVYDKDPAAKLKAIWYDSKNRDHPMYSEEFKNSQAELKFERVSELLTKEEEIAKQLKGKQASEDSKEKEHADAMRVVHSMGVRPGSEDDTKAEKKAYGVTTLEGRHVETDEDGNTRLHFIGKDGVENNLPVPDKDVASMLQERAKQAGPDGQLFPNVSQKSLGATAHELDGGNFKTKDFRTALGTKTAIEAVDKMTAPTNEKEYKKAVKEVAIAVATKLGNTAAVALSSYIAPQVFSKWKAAISAS